MKYNVSFEQISNELVNIFGDADRLNEYNTPGARYLGLCGFAGPMSPMTREAFIGAFGLQTVVLAEAAAKMRINENGARYDATHHAEHVREADAREGTNAAPAVGSFVWAIHNGLKNEGEGLRGMIKDLAEAPEYFRRRLVCVEKVYNLTAEDFAADATPDRLVKEAAERGEDFPGGARTEDDNFTDLFDEYKTYYTLAAAVVDPSGRWYLIDGEGYNYARYLLAPTNAADMFADELTTATAAKEAREEEERKEAARKEAEELAEYRARCEKWAGLMVDVRPIEQAQEAARKAKGWGCQEVKDAARKLQAAKRANITAMVRAAFPGLKFSLRKHDGWGCDYKLTYTDGPTLAEFEAATDLRLFRCGFDTFDGMTDCAGYEREKYTDFARAYMGQDGADIEADRDYSPEALDAMGARVCELTGKDKEAKGYAFSELRTVADAFGVDVDKLWPDVKEWHSGRDVAFCVWRLLSLYTRPEKAATATETAENGEIQDDAPADGLELVNILDGVAVVGDPRTTYKNRKAIKAHGATWNKEAKRWEATGEAADRLRAWFLRG